MIFHGNCLDRMKEMPDNSVDSIVTDPPYGLSFMGKKWDYDVPSTEIWIEALRVLKPGGHLLAFFGTRTYHRGVVRIEDAGFEIRDQIMWIYASGFPKSHNIGKAIDKQSGVELEVVGKGRSGTSSRAYQSEDKTTAGEYEETRSNNEWSGWGTALKPANEPIVVARKPLEKGLTIAENVQKWGCGGLNIDGSRVEAGDDLKPVFSGSKGQKQADYGAGTVYGNSDKYNSVVSPEGRWPANIIFDEAAAEMLGEPSRFFYVAKASKSERNRGLDSSDLIWEQEIWEKQDLNSDLMDMFQLAKGTFAVTTMADNKWSIDSFGKKLTDLFPTATTFTILTALKLITELRTLSAFQSSIIKENTQDAIITILANGSSPVETAENIRQLQPSITSEETESVLGVVLVVLPTLQKIKDFAKSGNFHSTVKPIKLMEYLIKLVTPPKGIVLDPFMGSGSTGVAAKNLGFDFIGIELNEEYIEIAKKRIETA